MKLNLTTKKPMKWKNIFVFRKKFKSSSEDRRKWYITTRFNLCPPHQNWQQKSGRLISIVRSAPIVLFEIELLSGFFGWRISRTGCAASNMRQSRFPLQTTISMWKKHELDDSSPFTSLSGVVRANRRNFQTAFPWGPISTPRHRK